MIAHISGNVSIKEPLKKWCALLSGKSLAENKSANMLMMLSKNQNTSLKVFEVIFT